MEDGLGWKFWLWVIGVSLAVGIGGILLFLLIGAAWYRWGLLGALILFGVLAPAYGHFYDRRPRTHGVREPHRNEPLARKHGSLFRRRGPRARGRRRRRAGAARDAARGAAQAAARGCAARLAGAGRRGRG